MKLRQLTIIYSANKHIDDGEMLLWRALPLHQRTSLGYLCSLTIIAMKGCAALAIAHIRTQASRCLAI